MGGNLNIINQWGEPKKEGENQIVKVQKGEAKGGITIFDLNLLVGKTLEETMTPLNKPISLIANLSFLTRIFPTNLKTANVVPIFKKNDHTSCNNYHPISSLSSISKITERLIHSCL